jgi:signal transduction histidine kinase
MSLKASWKYMASPAADQQLLYTLCIPIKFINILVAVFIIINKRTDEEKYLKSAVTELERVNEGLRQFAYVTSHDLKTPLRNIATYLQLLKRKNQLDSESIEMVDSAVKSVKATKSANHRYFSLHHH